jgi:hypothetical protein
MYPLSKEQQSFVQGILRRPRFCLEWARFMSQSPMTSQEVKAMVTARREYDDAVTAFDAAIREKPDSKVAITEALHTMLAKQQAYQAFGERVS